MQAILRQRAGVRATSLQRLRVTIHGAVQGVGFRPFVYRLANELALTGWVSNTPQGVVIEVEGQTLPVENFWLRLEKEKPANSFIQNLEASFLDAAGYSTFEIRHSAESGARTALVLPDIATCPECRREIFDPANRRYRYPFTNCTNCGPRFTLITALPYDRPNTTMKSFLMCRDCLAEYENPADRRFHAQPNACPHCGPQVELWDHEGLPLAAKADAVFEAVEALRRGKIVAVKGLGGFHLLVDAANAQAVQLLRQRKHRDEKPFALMYPHLDMIKAHCEVAPLEERLLLAPEAPIVLLKSKSPQSKVQNLASSVAPNNPYLGVMLPYTPLHHLLLHDFGLPVVATSGNLADEPICIDAHEALQRLGKIADLFLVHNRAIARHVDDSIVRVMMGRELVLRRARGYAPLPIHLQHKLPSLLAVGAHLKNSVALAVGPNIFVSQHLGDLETAPAYEAFQRVIGDFEKLYAVQPAAIACDLHPEYLSTKFARQYAHPIAATNQSLELDKAEQSSKPQRPVSNRSVKVVGVQHHFAHLAACMAENELEGSVLGVAWDGTGYGLDGTIWGGEFLRATKSSFERVAHLRTFRLPGGESAIKEPRRIALGLLYEMEGDSIFAREDYTALQAFSKAELRLLQNMLRKNLNSPRTSSAGRLFDAVAAISGLRQQTTFEGQAAMALEFALEGIATEEDYAFEIFAINRNGSPGTLIVDWAPMMRQMLEDQLRHLAIGIMAAKFHNTLVEMIVAVARRMAEERIVLSGGCFQNKYLTERAIRRLRETGFRPYWHQRLPPNDGGIALGQAVVAGTQMEER